MRLTRFTDYSLRLLIYLGAHDNSQVSVGDIAQAYDISKNHLMKVILFLSKEGYVQTTRGKGGGVKLKLQPEQINIGQLIRKSEAGSVLVECFSQESSACRIEPACLLQDVLYQASRAFYDVLSKYTLADLITNRGTLERLLRIA